MRSIMFLAALLFMVSGCQSSMSCGLVGCVDQVAVSIKPATSFPYSVDLVLDGHPTSFTCDAMGVHGATTMGIVQLCDTGQIIVAATPMNFQVTLTAGGNKRTLAPFFPSYSNSNPNGPDCMPTCKQATVTLN